MAVASEAPVYRSRPAAYPKAPVAYPKAPVYDEYEKPAEYQPEPYKPAYRPEPEYKPAAYKPAYKEVNYIQVETGETDQLYLTGGCECSRSAWAKNEWKQLHLMIQCRLCESKTLNGNNNFEN